MNPSKTVVILLFLLGLVALVGGFVLVALGKPIPAEVWPIGTAVVAGLTGFLAHSSGDKPDTNDAPPAANPASPVTGA